MEKALPKLLAFPSKSWLRRGRSQQSSSPAAVLAAGSMTLTCPQTLLLGPLNCSMMEGDGGCSLADTHVRLLICMCVSIASTGKITRELENQ
jgi:hypothetical protein